MLEKTIGDFGGPKENATVVINRKTDIDADEYNDLLECAAQTTLMVGRALVKWPLTAGATEDPVANDIVHTSVWGRGTGQRPAITKTAASRYTLTWPTPQVNGLSESESVSFSWPTARGVISDVANDDDLKVRTIAANVVTVQSLRAGVAFDPAVTGDAYGFLGVR